MIKTILRKTVMKLLDKLGLKVTRVGDIYQMDVYQNLYNKNILDKRPFYNIGAGSFYHPYWTNIDYISPWYKGVQKNVVHYDLMSCSPLPIESNSALILYTSHTIEHVSEEAVKNLFKEAYRALQVGGVFRVTTGPDAETDFNALIRNDSHWFYWNDSYNSKGSYEHIFHHPARSIALEEQWLHHFASQLCPNDKSQSEVKYSSAEIKKIINSLGFEGALNFFTKQCTFNPDRPGNHITWWTHEKIINFLQEAGFKTIYRSGFSQSVSPLMRRSPLFDSTHPQISIYVEAIR